jgi:hypothetical protein
VNLSVWSSGEWYRKDRPRALAHRLHYWTEGRNGCQMLTDCGKEIQDERPLVRAERPPPKLGEGHPAGFCRVCRSWR